MVVLNVGIYSKRERERERERVCVREREIQIAGQGKIHRAHWTLNNEVHGKRQGCLPSFIRAGAPP